MPANIIVEDAVMRLTAAATWGWGTSIVSTPNFGNYIDVSFTTGTGNKVRAATSNAVVWADIAVVLSTTTDSYHASPNFGLFANVPPLTVGLDGTILGILISIQPTSAKWNSGLTPLIRDDSTGSFTATVTVPAIAPIPPPPVGAPVPDPLLVKTGTWEWIDHGQSSVVLIDND